jgi:hypothetical protein
MPVGTTALGVLLYLALLLSAHGHRTAAVVGLGAACAAEAIALVAGIASWLLPGPGAVVLPGLSGTGPAVVPAVACGCAAAALLAFAFRALARASAHHRPAVG